MEWKIAYLEKDGIVCVKTTGLITWDSNRKMSEEVLFFASSKGSHKIIVDHRLMEPNLSTLQIDNLPAMFKEIGVGADLKVAILFNPAFQQKDNFTFFDNVTRLASLQFRSFTDKSRAISWLKSEN
jgi:hypothetical protein